MWDSQSLPHKLPDTRCFSIVPRSVTGKKAHSLDLFCNIESAEISWLLLTPYKTFNVFGVAP